ncbi:RNA-directed DNA polymerase, eukaryota, reverse transcriptase zinc-binding domain protein [Tanacetum coccineum]
MDYIPTVINENGNEVVIFDEDLVQKGSKRWCLTICGQFVGYDMHINGLRYNIRRMWGKYGVTEIDVCKNGQYMFKFRNNEGLNVVLDKGPWMLGAWKENSKGSKKVQVKYDWKPPACTHCKVFGHETRQCKEGFIEVNGKVGDQNQAKSNDNVEGYKGDKQDRNAGFMMQGKRRMFNKENNNNGIPPNVRSNISSFRQNSDVNRINSHEPRHEYRRKQGDAEINDKRNDASNKDNNRWLVKDKVVEELRKTTNKFSAFDSLPEDNGQELRMLKDIMFVDKYLNKKIQPTPNEAMSWSKDMAKYFKDKWEEDRQKKMEEDNGNDVFEDVCSDFSGIAKTMEDNEIDGIEGRVLNDDSYRV